MEFASVMAKKIEPYFAYYDGLIGFSNEDAVAGPLTMNAFYKSGIITKNVFDI